MVSRESDMKERLASPMSSRHRSQLSEIFHLKIDGFESSNLDVETFVERFHVF